MTNIMITSVESVEVERFPCQRHKMPPGADAEWARGEKSPIMVEYETEYVYGERFRDEDGADHQIGMTEEAREQLGIFMRVFDAQAKDLKRCRDREVKHLNAIKGFASEAADLQTYIDAVQCASLWQRLKWLFTGVTDKSET